MIGDMYFETDRAIEIDDRRLIGIYGKKAGADEYDDFAMLIDRETSIPAAVFGEKPIEGDELYTLSERGWVTLTPKGETLFTPDPAGNARYQLPGDEEWCDTVLKYLRLMAIQH